MFSNIQKSITKKLIFWFVITTIIPILIAGFMTLSLSREAVEREIFSKLENTADLKVQKIETIFNGLKTDLNIFQQSKIISNNFLSILLEHNDPSYIKSKQELDAQIQHVVKLQNSISDVYLLDLEQTIVYTSLDDNSPLIGTQLVINDKKFFDNAKSQVIFSDVFPNPDGTNNSILYVVGPLFDSDEKIIGFIVIEINMIHIFDLVSDRTGLGETGETLIGQKNDDDFAVFIIPLRHDPDAAFNRKVHITDTIVTPIRESVQGIESFGHTPDYRPEPVIAVWRYVPIVDWGLVAKIDQSEAFIPIFALEQTNLTLAISFALLVGVIGYVISRNISRPIIALKNNASQIGNGIFPNPIKSTTKDELSLLINSFNKMSDDLAKSRDIIKKHPKELLDERFSVIGELSARLAHDIRNPLSIIQISLDNLKIKYGTDVSKEKQFDKVSRSIVRITHQIDNVLDYVKGHVLELNIIKFSEIIAESMDSLNIPDNIKIILPKNDIELIGDKKQFSVAMNNLILNGIQAVEGSGTIEITVKENDDVIIIQVKDSGKGIPKEDIKKIFDPLFTTKQQGTGLGLAGVKSIIESHGGIISATSPPTIFTITLPKISE